MSPIRWTWVPAAELFRIESARCARVGNSDHPHVALRIFVAEKRQRTRSQRFLERHDSCFDGGIQSNLLVYLLLDIEQFVRTDRSEMGEIETKRSGAFSDPACLT